MSAPSHTERFMPANAASTPLLLNPGPINVSTRVAYALLTGDMCHREPEFFEVQDAIRRLLCEAFAPEGYAPVLLTGSGTAALEAAVSSLVGPEDRLLVLENGVYGDRIAAIATAHGIDHERVELPWTEPHDPGALAARLDADPSLTVVAGVQHETTTGLLNPVRELAQVCRERGRTFLVDAISAIGGEELDVAGWGIDAVVGTANKCIRGLPGLSFVLVEEGLMARAAAYPPRSLYLHLPTYHAKQEAQGTPFTPAVQTAYAFRAALQELLDEGVSARVDHMAQMSDLLRAGCERLGLELLLPPERRSKTITAIRLPAGWDYDALHDALRAGGFVIYAGQGDLRETAFRVSNMGVMDAPDYERFLSVLEQALAGEAP